MSTTTAAKTIKLEASTTTKITNLPAFACIILQQPANHPIACRILLFHLNILNRRETDCMFYLCACAQTSTRHGSIDKKQRLVLPDFIQ